jgi:hypothetical protein
MDDPFVDFENSTIAGTPISRQFVVKNGEHGEDLGFSRWYFESARWLMMGRASGEHLEEESKAESIDGNC